MSVMMMIIPVVPMMIDDEDDYVVSVMIDNEDAYVVSVMIDNEGPWETHQEICQALPQLSMDGHKRRTTASS